jgi:hypothetical protein
VELTAESVTKHWGDPLRFSTVLRIVLCALDLLVVAFAAVAQPSAKMPQVGVLHNGRQADEPRLRVFEGIPARVA